METIFLEYSTMDNYFDFFNLPVAFNIDTKQLRMAYIANSKKYHPDFHTLEDGTTQEEVLRLSTLNNEGWKTLKEPMSRIAHVLRLNDAMPEEGAATVPKDFLMEMMDINEALMELEFDEGAGSKETIFASIAALEESLHKEGKAAMAAWDEDKESGFLKVVRDYFLKLKYVLRIKEKIS